LSLALGFGKFSKTPKADAIPDGWSRPFRARSPFLTYTLLPFLFTSMFYPQSALPQFNAATGLFAILIAGAFHD
jgi:hypothetical protein